MIRLHFGYSRNKNFGLALLQSNIATNHTIKGQGVEQWHIVEFDTSDNFQLNLAANIYRLTSSFEYPKLYGGDLHRLLNCASNNGVYKKTSNYIYAAKGKQAEKQLVRIIQQHGLSYSDLTHQLNEIINQIDNDHKISISVLEEHGYLKSDYNGALITYTDRVKDVITDEFNSVKELIKQKRFKEAVSSYYTFFGNNIMKNDIFCNELVHLKREAEIQLNALELLALYSVSNRNKVVLNHNSEFRDLVDNQIKQREESSLPTPLSILKENVPTIEKMMKDRNDEWHKSVFFSDGDIKRDHTKVTSSSFSVHYDRCLKGNIFEILPDPVRRCEIWEIPESKRYWSLWTPIGPSLYTKEVTNKKLHLGFIDCLTPAFKSHRLIKSDEISLYSNSNEITLSSVGGESVAYTGRVHKIEQTIYYEVNVLRSDIDKAKNLGNVLLELIEEIYRDAENELREKLGLPKIGEGWVSEMSMFHLLKQHFPDAKHHAKPNWLKPQHLDVYIESQKIAFEYQGKQHFEAVDFFGGVDSFSNMQRLDQRKAKLCKKNGIRLIYWNYDQEITDKQLQLLIKDTVV